MKNDELKPKENSKATWPTWATDRVPRDLALRRKLFMQFAHWTAKLVPDLWGGRRDFQLDAIEHQGFLEKLLGIASNSDERRILSRWWDSLISNGNKTGLWKIAFLNPEVVLPDVPPAFVHRDVKQRPILSTNQRPTFSTFSAF